MRIRRGRKAKSIEEFGRARKENGKTKQKPAKLDGVCVMQSAVVVILTQKDLRVAQNVKIKTKMI